MIEILMEKVSFPAEPHLHRYFHAGSFFPEGENFSHRDTGQHRLRENASESF
ncbi:MAG TPA: hypothetical protein VEI57_15800 [Nitrospirota bacterium]|nr:hypothetical protein [Nitrospirota bacterium]